MLSNQTLATVRRLGRHGLQQWVEARSRAAIQHQLPGLEDGQLRIEESGQPRRSWGIAQASEQAVVRVHDGRFWLELLLGGSVGVGRAYAEGLWSSPDLAAVTRLFAKHQHVWGRLRQSRSPLRQTFWRLAHTLRRNSVAGSRRNIAMHYDLGNAFFALMLDPTMSYSSAVFPSASSSLQEASVHKAELICRQLDLRPGEHLLEIGSGWGYLAIHAAKRFGCRVSTATVSEAQYRFVQQRIADEGLSDRIDVRLQDYRALRGSYDKLVSIEMIEAVGHHYFGSFFVHCDRLLKPGGRMVLQSITVPDNQYERARKSVDFIKAFIFPGCCIPSVDVLQRSMEPTSLRLLGMNDIGRHYGRTLEQWRQNLRLRWQEAKALGFSETHLRLWEFYLAYTQGGFDAGCLGDAQLTLLKQGSDGAAADSCGRGIAMPAAESSDDRAYSSDKHPADHHAR